MGYGRKAGALLGTLAATASAAALAAATTTTNPAQQLPQHHKPLDAQTRADIARSERAAEQTENARRAELNKPPAERERYLSRLKFKRGSARRVSHWLDEFHGGRIEASSLAPAELAPGTITHVLSDTAALITTTDGKTNLVDSSLPLRTPGSKGATELIDLALTDTATGWTPRNPLVPSTLPARATGTTTVGTDGIELTIPGAAASEGTRLHRAIVYANTGESSDTILQPVTTGVEVSALLRSEEALANGQTIKLRLPEGATLSAHGDGALVTSHSGRTLATIRAPFAVDSQGTAVPATLTVTNGDTVHVTLKPTSDPAYPVLSDPVIDANGAYWYGGNTNGFGDWNYSYNDSGFAPRFSCYIPVDCAHLDGLFYYVFPQTYPAGHYGYWQYTVPGGTDTYVNKVSWAHITTQHHGDWGIMPYPYWGITRRGGGMFVSQSIPTIDVSEFAFDQNGGPGTDSAIWGFSTDSSNSTSQWRSAYTGGVTIALDDTAAPAIASTSHSNATIAANGWLPENTTDTVTESVSDSGLGVKTISLAGVATTTDTRTHPCTGIRSAACPATWSQSFTYNTNALAEGTTTATVGATDPVNHSASAVWTVKVDKTKPDASELGDGWNPTGGVLTPSTHSITVNATDTGSGVKSITLDISNPGSATDAHQVANNTTGCTTTGCTNAFSHTFTFDASQYPSGPHTITVNTLDQVNHPGDTDSESVQMVDTTTAADTVTNAANQAVGEAGCFEGQITDPNSDVGDLLCSTFGTITEKLLGRASPGWSDTCASPQAQTVFDGFAGSTYAKLISDQPTPQESWVCFRIDAGSFQPGGRLDVPVDASAPLPSTDGNSGACTATAGNTIPGPHPMFSTSGPPTGTDTIDAYANASNDVWLCMRADPAVGSRVKLDAPSVNGTPVVHRDNPPLGPPDPTPGPAGFPSTTCQDGSGHVQGLNANIGGTQVWLYGWVESASKIDLCVRSEGGGTAGTAAGGMLEIDAHGTPGITPVGPAAGNDPTGCQDLRSVTVAGTTVTIGATPAGTNPAKVCVTSSALPQPVVLNAGFTGSPHPATVKWTDDPDSQRILSPRL